MTHGDALEPRVRSQQWAMVRKKRQYGQIDTGKRLLLKRDADQRAGHTFAGRTHVVQVVTGSAVEIALEGEVATTPDEQAVQIREGITLEAIQQCLEP
jgi:hypothetical protein